MIKCDKCGNVMMNPDAVKAGRKGGSAKVSKGFASKTVQDKAQATLKARRSANAA